MRNEYFFQFLQMSTLKRLWANSLHRFRENVPFLKRDELRNVKVYLCTTD